MFRLPLPSTLVAYKRILGSDPAAGAEISETVPAGKFWIPLSIWVELVQGLTQTPQPILVIDDGATQIFEAIGSSAAQIASSTCKYTWGLDLPLSGQVGATPNTRSTAPLSPIVLPGGFRIRTVTLGIGANSNYGAPGLYVAELG